MANSAKTSAQVFASLVMSLAILALAAALVYFTYEMSRVSSQIPDILDSVNQTTDKVAPVVGEIGAIRELVPDILLEVEQTRQLVPPILEEAEQIRLQIPPVLEEVEAVRKEIPAVLKSADGAVVAMSEVANQVEASRPLIEETIRQVETTRESIPPMLDRADAIVNKARAAGQEASSGAVTGFFKGLVTTPFTLVGDAGRAIAGVSEEEMNLYTEKDMDLIEATALDLLNNGGRGEVRNLSNPDSGLSASITLVSVEQREEDFTTIDCRTLQMDSYKHGERIKTVNKTICREEGGGWAVDE